jgi:hypothetical protein
MYDQTELRRRYQAWTRAMAKNERLPFPSECSDLRCGARTRSGTPCKRRDLYASGRCRLHGGLSTGPKSGPRAKRPEPPKVEAPYDPMENPEYWEILLRQGLPVHDIRREDVRHR